MPMKYKYILSAVTGFAVLGATAAQAAGFFLEERSVKASGRAYAGAAAQADDASVLSFNPAAITLLPGTQSAGGVYAIIPKAKLTDTGSTATVGPFAGIPVGGAAQDQGFSAQPSGYIYGTQQVSGDLWFGVGISVPFGLKNNYDAGFFGRYDSTKSEVTVIEVAPTLAYRVAPGVSVGASLALQRSTATLVNAIPNPFDPLGPNAASDGVFRVKGNDWDIGYTVGLLFQPAGNVRMGVSYRGAVSHRLTGTATTDFLGMVTSQDVAADLRLPDVISAALAYDATARFTLLASVSRYNWSRFKEVRLEFADNTELASPENFQDAWGVSLGAQADVSENWTLRGGVEFDEAPSVDAFRSTRIPDADRLWLTAGASYRVSEGVSIDFSYAHMFKKTEPINRTTPFPLLATTVFTSGTTNTSSNVLGLGFSAAF